MQGLGLPGAGALRVSLPPSSCGCVVVLLSLFQTLLLVLSHETAPRLSLNSSSIPGLSWSLTSLGSAQHTSNSFSQHTGVLCQCV